MNEQSGASAGNTASGATRAILRGSGVRHIIRTTVRNLRRLPVYALSKIRRRDRTLWLFGNIHGFRDSPRYLAEHILHTRPELTPVWIAHSSEEATSAAAAGLDVALDGDDRAKALQRKAGVAFFSHGFRDLDLALVAGAFIVWLWHGKSLKRVGLDAGSVRQRRPFAIRVAVGFVRSFQARAYKLVGMYVASSEFDRDRFITAFAAPPRRIRILGSPRFDVIRGGPEYTRVVGAGTELRASLGYAPDDRIVLWLPTHRTEYGGDEGWLPELSARDLDDCLGSTNIKLLVKTHPNADFTIYRSRLPEHPRLELLPETAVDVNCLMHISDAMISDYSSAVFDYAILGRPIHFFAPDAQQFADRRGLYEPYETLTGGSHRCEWSALLSDLREDARRGEESVGSQNSRRVREYCGHNLEPEACARIVATTAREVSAAA